MGRSQEWKSLPASDYLKDQIAALKELGLVSLDIDPECLTTGEGKRLIEKAWFQSNQFVEKFPIGTILQFPHEEELYEVVHHSVTQQGRIVMIHFSTSEGKLKWKQPQTLLYAKIITVEPVVSQRRKELRQRIHALVAPFMERLYDAGKVEDLRGQTLAVELGVLRMLKERAPDAAELDKVIKQRVSEVVGFDVEND